MAPDESTPKQPDSSVERQVSNLLGYLQTPIKQVQEWASGGQFQSTIEHLQEQAERAQEGVERRLRALKEVRQGLEIHVKKQLDAYRHEKEELTRRAERASTGEPRPAEPEVAEKPPADTGRQRTAPAKAKAAAKKSGSKRSTGRKQ